MAEPRHIAVFDVGKTSSKVVLLDGADLSEIDVRRMKNAALSGPPYPHIDVEGQWDFLCAALREFGAKYGVDAIAIATHGATAALVKGGGLALPVLDYEHEISPSGYGEIRPDFSHTLSPSLPMGLNLGRQLYWLKTVHSEGYKAADHILTFPQYWCWRLTDEARSEPTSLGTHTDLWEPENQCFSSLVQVLGMEKFPSQATPSNTFPLSKSAALECGLSTGIPVTCGIHDSNASLLPWLDQGNISVISSGTWCIVMGLGGCTRSLDPHRDMLANVDALGRPVATSRFMGGREFEVLTDGASVEVSGDDIVRAIAADFMALPSYAPGTGPFPEAVGRWAGAAPETPHEKSTAATLYLALMCATCLDLIGAGERIIVEGPFAKNEMLLALISALAGRPVYASQDATGTAVGAAMLVSKAKPNAPRGPILPADLEGLEAYAQRWKRLSAAG